MVAQAAAAGEVEGGGARYARKGSVGDLIAIINPDAVATRPRRGESAVFVR
jgi:hypothetical protein